MNRRQTSAGNPFAARWLGGAGRLAVIIIPYLWMVLFLLGPVLIVLKISFSESTFSSPPVAPLVELNAEEGILTATFRLFNYGYLFADDFYLNAYLNSIGIAAISTFWCFIIGYPMALAIARSPRRWQPFLLLAIILPFSTSLLLRVYAWLVILRQDGLVNTTLQSIGLIDAPLPLLYTGFATYLGIVYTYLPFMILPIYVVLERHDPQLLAAARDLGASRLKAFLTVTWPLSLSGVIAGSMLVFIPVVGEFIIPTLLSGDNTIMIGRVLWDEFFLNRDWPLASALAIMMLAILIVPIAIFQAQQAKGDR